MLVRYKSLRKRKQFFGVQKKMNNEKLEQMLTNSSKVVGSKQVLKGISDSTVRCVIVASDADAQIRKKIVAQAKAKGVEIAYVASKKRLGESVGVEVSAAAVGIVEKIMSFLFLIPSSMLSAVSALGAQNIGAEQPKRAALTLRYSIFITVGFGLLSSVIMQFAAEPVVSLFTDKATAGGADVIRLGGQYLRGYIWDSIFAGIHFSFSGYFCACGKSELSFLHNIIAITLVRIPGAYIASKLFPATLFPMGLATAAGSLLSVMICIIAFAVIMHRTPQLKKV